MGGKALKEIETRRITKEEYDSLVPSLIEQLKVILPNSRISDIPSYFSKKDFGDADILVESKNMPPNWVELVKNHFKPKQTVKNGDVLSFEHQNFQIDLITSPSAEFDFSKNYFSYNDLGNLIGRIAHNMGFKFSHSGLRYIMRDLENDSFIVSDITASNNFNQSLEFCGFNAERFHKGFENLNDIFNYVLESKYFDLECYLLENRNYRDRTRDRKRKTYSDFLNFCQELKEQKIPLNTHTFDKSQFLLDALNLFPSFKQEYERGLVELEQRKIVKTKFNSELVQELTGLKEQKLGKMMQLILDGLGTKDEKRMFFLDKTPDEIKTFILDTYHMKFMKENKKPSP